MSEQDPVVQLKQSELQALMKSIADLRGMVAASTANAGPASEGTVKTRRVRESVVSIMFLDGRPVIGMDNRGTEEEPVRLYEEVDPKDPRKYIMYADLIVLEADGETERVVKKVPFLNFIQQGERRECRVAKISKKEWEMNFGTTERRELKNDEYDMQGTGQDTDLIVEGVDMVYHVEIGGGEVIELSQEYVNMARAASRARKDFIAETI